MQQVPKPSILTYNELTMIKEILEINNLNEDIKEEKTFIKELNNRFKNLKTDIDTNNFRGGVESIKGLCEDFLRSK